ncbi:Glycosyltransferase family 25 (LPS biosynthesis protein) [Nitrosospira multiformis]|uniref:Glycosyltransferase family 25 (LPS biosynthesis protein) n=1 Tax=Nitrosospira multiformis TaxID=1231 RepID=A0A1I7I7P9_9PROT|nr:Glycosyltransferase family 25 (LPS biosynthesis protein) [Nitrosospira multiformis]
MLRKRIRYLATEFFHPVATIRYFQKHPEVLQGYFLYAWKLGFFNALVRLFKILKREKPRQAPLSPATTAKLVLRTGSTASVVILTTDHCLYLARSISVALSRMEIASLIIHEPPGDGYSNNLHFVISPQMFAQLPAFYIAVQMEQSVSSRWFNDDYLKILRNSAAILDYSIPNIRFLTFKKGVNPRQLFYVPLGYIADYTPEPDYTLEDCDVIFYGDAHNRRRLKFLQELKKHFRVKIIGNLFGEELYAELARARIVVNIHYYEEALLETTRIWECLSLHKLVVSERSSDMDQHADLMPLIDFVDVGDVSAMVERVRYWLGNDTLRRERIAENRLLLQQRPNRFDYFFYRFLLATDNITFKEFWHLAGHKIELPSNTVCLSLPEYVERAEGFIRDNKFGFSAFPGLRHTQSWIGCAMSYKYLTMLARQQGLRQIMICEDDVEFPSDFEMRWRDIQECLNDADITWDIFAGLIADLDKDVDVLGLYKFRDQQFAVINKLMSMVFNVYSERVYDTIARWDENNHDVTTNTIDRYLERQEALNILTVDPFLVGHKESQQSTIWGVENTHYTDLIKASNQLLKEKILIHKKNASFPRLTLGCPDLPLRDVTHQHRDQEL